MPNFVEIFAMVHAATTMAPDLEKLVADLDLCLHKYVGPDVDKLKADLIGLVAASKK